VKKLCRVKKEKIDCEDLLHNVSACSAGNPTAAVLNRAIWYFVGTCVCPGIYGEKNGFGEILKKNEIQKFLPDVVP